jgi:hypothetical protein
MPVVWHLSIEFGIFYQFRASFKLTSSATAERSFTARELLQKSWNMSKLELIYFGGKGRAEVCLSVPLFVLPVAQLLPLTVSGMEKSITKFFPH